MLFRWSEPAGSEGKTFQKFFDETRTAHPMPDGATVTDYVKEALYPALVKVLKESGIEAGRVTYNRVRQKVCVRVSLALAETHTRSAQRN